MEAKWELPVSGGPGPRQQLNSGAIQRKPGAAPSTLLLCLSLYLSLVVSFCNTEILQVFFAIETQVPLASPHPLVAYLLFEQL